MGPKHNPSTIACHVEIPNYYEKLPATSQCHELQATKLSGKRQKMNFLEAYYEKTEKWCPSAQEVEQLWRLGNRN